MAEKHVEDGKSGVQAGTTSEISGEEESRRMKALVIDDDPDIVEVVSLCFELRWPDATVLSASTGELGIKQLKSEKFDITILDIGLPDIEGFEVCRRIRAFSYMPVIMLTVRKEREEIIKALDLGADDYIAKPFRPVEFLARVNAVLRRNQLSTVSSGEVAFQVGDFMIDFGHGEVHIDNQSIQLTGTEYQLFYHLVKNAGKMVASKTLLNNIWGEEYRSEPYFLAARFTQLKQKLEGHFPVRRLILKERPEGYTLVAPS